MAAVDPIQLPILFNEDTPPCEYQEIATNIEAHGAHLAIGMGVGTTSKTGDATVSGSTISGSSNSLSTGIGIGTRAQEVGGQAVAYVCVSGKKSGIERVADNREMADEQRFCTC